jgi:hypothetical protein
MPVQRHWVQADLVCLQCGRAVGRVAGAAGCEPFSVKGYSFSVFRPADRHQPVRRLRRKEHFRCDVCGGNVLLEHVEHFTTYDEQEEAPVAHRRGRRPTPMPRMVDPRLIELGLAS